MFGQATPPVLPYAEDELEKLAEEVLKSQTTVTGVQAKLSLHLASGDHRNAPKRFTIVGLWGSYILKPPTPNYSQLPEVEDLTMHMAGQAKIIVVPHSLIRMKSGNLAYITRRIDRVKRGKLHMEDMCQLTERLTEEKYNGSYEQIGKVILKNSSNPGLDIVNFCELVLFSFLTGNSDMHLKNFSLIQQPEIGIILAPAYDLLSTALVNPADDEDMALTLNGKKKKLKVGDFKAAFSTLLLDEKQQENIFKKMGKHKSGWLELIDNSFLSDEFKLSYKALIDERFRRIS
jgi:serine/threonine-protein kinase HipA